MKVFVALCFSAGLVSCGMAFDIIAHRGENTLAPENSLESARLAWKNGAKFVEGDFYETREGVLVCVHGRAELKKLAGIDKPIEELTAADIAAADISANDKWRGKYSNVKIPLASEILKTVPEGGTFVFEVKNYTPDYAEKLDAAVKAAGLKRSRVAVIAFNKEALADIKKKFPEYKCLWLCARKKDKGGAVSPSADEVAAVCGKNGFDGVNMGGSALIDAEYVAAVKKAGLLFYVWTVNNCKEAARLKSIGVDAVATDKAGEFLRAQSEK